MSLPESASILRSTLSCNELCIGCPRPILAYRSMSFPQAKKRLLSLRPANLERQKVSQESVIKPSNPHQPQDVTTTKTTAHPVVSGGKGQSTGLVAFHDPTPNEQSRKRDMILQWLDKQAQRLRWRRDSLLFSRGLKRDLRRASRNVNAIITGPNGEPVPQHVIDQFFTRYPDGGSDWRNSARWEDHLAEHFARTAAGTSPERSPSPVSPSRFSFSRVSWGSKVSGQKNNRGKLPEDEASEWLEQTFDIPDREEFHSHRVQTSRSPVAEAPLAYRPTYRRLISWDHHVPTTRYNSPPARSGSEPRSSTLPGIDASKIPPLPIQDLKPLNSEDFDPNNLSEITGRPRELSPIHSLAWPLPHSLSSPPSTPQLEPEQRTASISELELVNLGLDTSDPHVTSIDPLDSLTTPSPMSVAMTIERWPCASELRNITTSSTNSNDNEYRRLSQTFQATTIANTLDHNDELVMPATRKPSSIMVPAACTVQFPPTPPHSRHTSDASQPDLRFKRGDDLQQSSLANPTHHQYTITHYDTSIRLPPADMVSSPANRNWEKRVLSDTTGSSLPNCPVFISAADQRRRHQEWWNGMAERHSRF
jgi:hypothetical protein